MLDRLFNPAHRTTRLAEDTFNQTTGERKNKQSLWRNKNLKYSKLFEEMNLNISRNSIQTVRIATDYNKLAADCSKH